MSSRAGFLATMALALIGGAWAAPAVAPLPAPAALEPASNTRVHWPGKLRPARKSAAVLNPDALDLSDRAEVVDNYELGASVGGSDVPGASDLDKELEAIVNEITKPPAPKKQMAPAPAKVPETALPRKPGAPAPAPRKSTVPPAAAPQPAPARASPPAVPLPSGETGALSRVELVALAARMFPRPRWRAFPTPADARAHFGLPRGI